MPDTYVFVKNGMGDYTSGTGAREDMLMQLFNISLYQQGIVLNTDLETTEQSTPAMGVTVAAGRCFILNSSYTVNTANSTRFWGVLAEEHDLSISGNASGSTRYDIAVVQIDTGAAPNDYATNVASVEIVEGTPGLGVPATPSNALKLAEIEVVNGASSITNSNITDSRQCCGTQSHDGLYVRVPQISGSVYHYAYLTAHDHEDNASDAYTDPALRLHHVQIPSGTDNGKIQAAIDAFEGELTDTLKGSIELLPGTHLIDAGLLFDANSTSPDVNAMQFEFFGHGANTIIQPNDSNLGLSGSFSDAFTVQVTADNNFMMRDMAVVAPYNASANTNACIEWLAEASYMRNIMLDLRNDQTGVKVYGGTPKGNILEFYQLTNTNTNNNSYLFYLNGTSADNNRITAIAQDGCTWLIDSGCNYNIIDVAVDTAGTDNGTGNDVRETVF